MRLHHLLTYTTEILKSNAGIKSPTFWSFFSFFFFSTSINASTVIPLTVKTAKDATYGGIYLLMFCPLRHNENGRIKESVNNSSRERGIIETSMRAGEEDEVKTSHRINIYMMIYIYIYIKKLVQVEKVGWRERSGFGLSDDHREPC